MADTADIAAVRNELVDAQSKGGDALTVSADTVKQAVALCDELKQVRRGGEPA